MIVQEILTVPSDDPREELDRILAKCCELVLNGQEQDADFYGMVGACVVCPDGQLIYGVNYQAEDGTRVHAERAALERCADVSPDCIVVTTLSPCNRPMDERSGESCEDLIAKYGIKHVYCGYKDPTQDQDDSIESKNPKLQKLCKQLADTFLDEGRKKKRKSRGGYYVGYPWWGTTDSAGGEGGDGGGMEENFASGKTLDPDLYGEMLPTDTVKRIVTGVMNQVDPDAKVTVRQSPEGYYLVRSEGLRLDFGITADGGDIGANIVNAYSSYKGKNVVTEIFAQCFRAAEQLWGKPAKFVVSVQQDRGDGAWQAIAKKLGAEWGGSVMENFATGNSMSTKDMIAYLRQHHDTNLHQDYLDHINTFGKFVLKNIPVSTIKTELSGLDQSKVEQYKKMDFSKAPPIVMGDGYILDGYHRATVAKALGIPTIKGYVGIKGQQDMAENFADGKVKGKSRPGRVKRSGASCNGSVTDLRARAKRASGERAKMYHWCANMKSGRKKK
jgi:pyrimidine deaminase RibD-like protein